MGDITFENGEIRYNIRTSVEDTTLPRPITQWYQFESRIYWIEDAAYEHRNRFPGPVGRLLLSWHDFGVWAMPADVRETDFFQTTEVIRSYEKSKLSCTPNSPMTAYVKGAMERATEAQQEIIWMRINKEQAELGVHTIVHNAIHGITVSRSSDPRVTTSNRNGYGIIVPVSNALWECLTVEFLSNLYENSDIDPVRVLKLFSDARRINWAEMEKYMEDPFAWYDFNNSRIIDLPRTEEIEYDWGTKNVVRWGVLVFQGITIPTFT